MKGIWEGESCFFCGSTRWLERHHIFQGANRGRSEMDGLVVTLCHYCHNEPPDGVHFNRTNNLELKRMAQEQFEQNRTREEFRSLFGKSYL